MRKRWGKLNQIWFSYTSNRPSNSSRSFLGSNPGDTEPPARLRAPGLDGAPFRPRPHGKQRVLSHGTVECVERVMK